MRFGWATDLHHEVVDDSVEDCPRVTVPVLQTALHQSHQILHRERRDLPEQTERDVTLGTNKSTVTMGTISLVTMEINTPEPCWNGNNPEFCYKQEFCLFGNTKQNNSLDTMETNTNDSVNPGTHHVFVSDPHV